jgi:hypothetical protein
MHLSLILASLTFKPFAASLGHNYPLTKLQPQVVLPLNHFVIYFGTKTLLT